MRRKRAKKPPPSLVLTRARVLGLAAVGVAWTLLSPSFGAAILPPETISDWWHDIRQSETERKVDAYVEIARKGTTWVQTPTIYKPSVDYFEDHYDQLDPDEVHDLPDLGSLPAADIPALATEAAGMSGAPFTLSADVKGAPNLITPVTEEVGSFAVALADPRAPRTFVLCRLPYGRPLPFFDGDRVTTSGIVLADGLADRPQGAGMQHVIYMACSSMVKSTNITITPRPLRPGRGGRPRQAILEVNE